MPPSNKPPLEIAPMSNFKIENTLSGESLSGKSDEFFEKWRKFRPTKLSPDKVITICLNDLLPFYAHLHSYFIERKFSSDDSDDFFA